MKRSARLQTESTSFPAQGEVCAQDFATRKPVQIRWRDGIIRAIKPVDGPLDRDLWVAPSLVDLQVNGFGGIDFQQDGLRNEDLLAAVRALRKAGCARFLLTLITDHWPKMIERLARLRALRAGCPELQSAILGWHLEGPFLSTEPGFHGAHDPAFMIDPTRSHLRQLRHLTGTDPLLLTLAPERKGAVEAIARATSLGIKISVGHTNAPAQILAQAVAAGAKGFTHLGNACPQLLDRHDNIVWRVLDTPGLTVSLIPDSIHVSPALFRLTHRALGAESVYYTTDAMAAAGAPPGRYTIGKMALEVGTDRIVRQPGRANFAGSALRPVDGVKRAAQMLGWPWQRVWRQASEVPARFMGVQAPQLKVGRPADFCLLNMGKDEYQTA